MPHSAVGTHFFKPFVPCIVRGALLVVFDTPGQIQALLGFVFLNFVPGGSDSVLVFLSLPDFVFDFVQELLVHTYNPPGIFPNFLLIEKLSSLL